MERELLRELYLRYGEELYRYLYLLCGDRMLAEDIRQEAFCKALIALPEGHPNMRAWFYKVCRNMLFSEMGRRKREMVSEEQPVVSLDDPAEQAELHVDAETVRSALLRLERRKREVLELTYFQHFTLREAAAVMGITHENARVLSSRGKKELRNILEVEGYDIS